VPPDELELEVELEVELELLVPVLVAEAETVPVVAPWPALLVVPLPPDVPADAPVLELCPWGPPVELLELAVVCPTPAPEVVADAVDPAVVDANAEDDPVEPAAAAEFTPIDPAAEVEVTPVDPLPELVISTFPEAPQATSTQEPNPIQRDFVIDGHLVWGPCWK
jgi:hypothetical protein